MARATSETMDLDALSAERRRALADELYDVQTEVFDGVDRKSFVKYVIESPSQSNWIEVYRVDGQAVGYFAIHRFDERVAGKPVSIFRAEAGVRRAWRGKTPFGRLFLRRSLPWIIAHRGRQHFYLGSLVHPSSYHGLARYAALIWPNATLETPPGLQQLMCDLGDRFGLQQVDPANPLIRAVGWCTRDTDVEALYWRDCTKPAARYFVEQNPGYGAGHGMLTLVPLALGNVLPAAFAMLKSRSGRWLTRLRAKLQSLPMLRPRVQPHVVAERLSTLEALQGLDAAARARLVTACRSSLAAPGQYIIREGTRGDRMYMILSGAVYVVRGRGPDEVILDELHDGEVFGEMALVSGLPRTASVRAATSVRLLEIERGAVLELAAADATVQRALEQAHDGRAFDTAIGQSEHFGHLTYEERWAWYDSSESVGLGAETSRDLPTGAVAFLAIGQAEVRIDERWVAVHAPAIIGGAGPASVRALRQACRLVILPRSPRLAEVDATPGPLPGAERPDPSATAARALQAIGPPPPAPPAAPLPPPRGAG